MKPKAGDDPVLYSAWLSETKLVMTLPLMLIIPARRLTRRSMVRTLVHDMASCRGARPDVVAKDSILPTAFLRGFQGLEDEVTVSPRWACSSCRALVHNLLRCV